MMTDALDPVRVRVLFFARYAELLGTESFQVTLERPATVAAALARVRSDLPGASLLPVQPLCAVNQAQAMADDLLEDGDELALLPPLAGG